MLDIKTKETITDIKLLDKSANFAAQLRASEIWPCAGALREHLPQEHQTLQAYDHQTQRHENSIRTGILPVLFSLISNHGSTIISSCDVV